MTILLCVAVAVAILVAAADTRLTTEAAFDLLSKGDNDDILRLLSVRAWLAGQDWYDMTQYRVLAPEGLALHWSRYVDAAIGALVLGAARFMPMEAAEGFALLFWPFLLFAVLTLITALAARRLFGAGAAIGAVACLFTWPVFLDNYFHVTRIDHHNVQIVLLTILILTLAQKVPTVRLGVIGGGVTALSLAVGLEMVPAIAVAGLVLGLRTMRAPHEEGGQLVAFLVTATVASVLLFFGQVPAEEWDVGHCDELSPPFLAMLSTGAVLGVVFCQGARKKSGIAERIHLLVICGAIGAAVAFVFFEHCRAGPYANLSPEVRDLIHSVIVEAKPGWNELKAGSPVALMIFVPLGAVLVFGAVAWAACRDPQERRGIAVYLVFGASAFVAMLAQQRNVVIAAGVVPILTGVSLMVFVRLIPVEGRAMIGRLGVVVVAGLTLLFPFAQTALMTLWQTDGEVHTQEARDVWAEGCGDRAHTRALASLPPGVVLTTDIIGASLLLVSDHTILAAPYHRSARAMSNIHLPFAADEAGFRAFVAEDNVDYVATCRLETSVADTFARQLALGNSAPGFERLPLPEGSPMVVYRVVK